MATVFSVRVCAGKGSFSVCLASENPIVAKVEVPAKAEDGKANRALVLGLEKLLSCRVSLLFGQTSRRKTLAADCTTEHLIGKMKEFEASKR
ncbi:MAG: DUF167 family protein [Candidatus Micrarchaeia archaeon]